MINSSIVITEYQNMYVSWLDINGKMEYLSVASIDDDIVGNIYLGRVKNVANNINACFVEIADKKIGFLSFNDCYNSIPHEGDLLCVQVVKAASKNKEIMLSAKLNLQGILCAASIGNGTIHVSRNISSEKKGIFRTELAGLTSYDIIVRTNAENADIAEIKREALELSQKLDTIINKSITRTAFSMLYESKPDYIKFVEGMKHDCYDRVITDIEHISIDTGCELYRDDYPLIKLYSLESRLNRILDKRVYLKSGGDIVIEHTEAMTVIDVNTGKNINKKNKDELVYLTNSEAAVEIARQLRLRNISGIIIVDFINMKDEELLQKLIVTIKSELKKDKIKADFIEFTKLGLAQIVRKKTSAPVYELLK